MKKILTITLLITSIGINQLNAYCIHNRSKNDKLRIAILKKRPKWSSFGKLDTHNIKAEHNISPGKKACWNWKSMGGKRTDLWYWVILSDKKRFLPTPQGIPIVYYQTVASGKFPIGSAIVFYGYTNNRPRINIHFGPNPTSMPLWQYKKAPWHLSKQPWGPFRL